MRGCLSTITILLLCTTSGVWPCGQQRTLIIVRRSVGVVEKSLAKILGSQIHASRLKLKSKTSNSMNRQQSLTAVTSSGAMTWLGGTPRKKRNLGTQIVFIGPTAHPSTKDSTAMLSVTTASGAKWRITSQRKLVSLRTY